MTASNFYKNMALSIAKNMSREAVKLVSVFLKPSSGNEVEVTPTTVGDKLTGTYTGVVIKEVEQDWILGIKQQRPVSFTVEPTTVEFNGADFVWGNVAYSNGTAIGNGKQMADYEYFYMGERGDQYRMVGWPDYVPTKYLVDPAKTYDTINLHFAYQGANHAVQLSEKDITILVPSEAGITDDIIAAINTAAGAEVVKPLTPTAESTED
jgi:glucosamine 6-phosphate synthetase-like amidotransferase/phosphosugar isomerase protein